MIRIRCDEEGRLQLQPGLRARYGEEFVVVEAPGELILFPTSDDAVKDLERLGKKLKGKSLKEIKQRIRDRALREARA